MTSNHHPRLKLARSAQDLPTQQEAVDYLESVMKVSGFEFSGSDGGMDPPDWTTWTDWFEVPEGSSIENGARIDVFARDYFHDTEVMVEGKPVPDREAHPPPTAMACPYALITLPAHEYLAQAMPTHPYHDPPSGKMPTGREQDLKPNWRPKGSAEIDQTAAVGEYASMDDMLTWIWDVLRATGYEPFRYDPEATYHDWANYRAWFTDGQHTIRVDLFADYDQEFHQRAGEAPCPWVALSFYDYLGDPRVVPSY